MENEREEFVSSEKCGSNVDIYREIYNSSPPSTFFTFTYRCYSSPLSSSLPTFLQANFPSLPFLPIIFFNFPHLDLFCLTSIHSAIFPSHSPSPIPAFPHPYAPIYHSTYLHFLLPTCFPSTTSHSPSPLPAFPYPRPPIQHSTCSPSLLPSITPTSLPSPPRALSHHAYHTLRTASFLPASSNSRCTYHLTTCSTPASGMKYLHSAAASKGLLMTSHLLARWVASALNWLMLVFSSRM